MKYFSPTGAPLCAISSKASPVSAWASSRGFAIVADEQMNCGLEP